MQATLHYLVPGQIEVILTERQQAIVAESRALLAKRKPVISDVLDVAVNYALDAQLNALELEFYNSGFKDLPPKAQKLRIELPE